MTIELWFVRSALEEASKDDGRLFRDLHSHPLFLDDGVAGHWCDACHTRIEERIAYSCRTCDYDMCMGCFKKASRKQSEGQLRGDAGVKDDVVLSNWSYSKKAMKYAAPYW